MFGGERVERRNVRFEGHKALQIDQFGFICRRATVHELFEIIVEEKCEKSWNKRALDTTCFESVSDDPI